MKNNRDGPGIRFFMGRGNPGRNTQLMRHKPRGDPGLYRHTRDNPVFIALIYCALIQFKQLKRENYA